MKDRRYTFTREWVGLPLPRWIVRFCDEFVSHHHSRVDAILAGAEHGTARLAALGA